jgi:hypothetical protein
MVAHWSLPKRVAFRFAFIYLVLYELPWLLKRPLLPDTRKTAESLASFEGAVQWFGHHVVGVASALPKEYPGGGDTLFQWVRVAFLFVVAAVSTAVWSLLDRRRPSYAFALDFLRSYLRYGLAFTMLFYGTVKIFPIQFAPPSLNHLLEPYGDSSPMGLLWTFMGFSRLYTTFSGLVEVLGAVLLLWRRTTLLGAIIVAGATANVLLLNLSYDVPVKLYSAHLLVMALFLAAPDGIRLLRTALVRRAAPLPPLSEPWPWPRVEQLRPWLKVALVAWCSFATVYFTVRQSMASPMPAPPALFGVWLVEFQEPTPANGTAWHHVVVNEWSEVTVERVDDKRSGYELTDDTSRSGLTLTHDAERLALTYVRPDADHLVIDGDINGEHVVLRLRRERKDFLLTSRGFHWVQEEPLVELTRIETPATSAPSVADRNENDAVPATQGDAKHPEVSASGDVVEAALARAIDAEVDAHSPGWEGRVAVLAGELQARRLARWGVVAIDAKRERRGA